MDQTWWFGPRDIYLLMIACLCIITSHLLLHWERDGEDGQELEDRGRNQTQKPNHRLSKTLRYCKLAAANKAPETFSFTGMVCNTATHTQGQVSAVWPSTTGCDNAITYSNISCTARFDASIDSLHTPNFILAGGSTGSRTISMHKLCTHTHTHSERDSLTSAFFFSHSFLILL